MKSAACDDYGNLLRPGESLRPVDRSGWIVTKNLFKEGDEAIIAYDGRNFSFRPALFDRPVRVRITSLSDLTLNFGLELLTPAEGWTPGNLDGWFDVLWQIQGVIVKAGK